MPAANIRVAAQQGAVPPFAALYKSTRLISGNPESSVGIITLWTKARELAAKIDPKSFCVMGNLYSAERGLDLLVRNLLANPQITSLVVTGVDFSKSGVVLLDFFKNGFERGKTDTTEKPVWRVRSPYEGYIDLDIPESALHSLRESVSVVHTPNLETFDFSSLSSPQKTREKAVFLKKDEEVKQFAGEYTGHIVRGRTVAEVWLKLLDRILRFGKESSTHYDDRQKEIVNLLSIISDEDPASLHIPDFLPQDPAHVAQYIPRITKDLPGGRFRAEYTYGSRMRSWFGKDQVKELIQKLVREPNSRSTVISLWDPTQDLTIGGAPCLNHIWIRLNESDRRLYMTCIFRSHDMFEGYPENAFGLRVLQEEIRKELVEELGKAGKPLPITLGDLMILSQSAHIYDDSWERCQTILARYLPQYVPAAQFQYDPRGNFVISLSDKKIVVEHSAPGSRPGESGEALGTYTGPSAEALRDQLVRQQLPGSPAHGLYLGKELAKAELALRLGIEYIQDQPLDFGAVDSASAMHINLHAGILPMEKKPLPKESLKESAPAILVSSSSPQPHIQLSNGHTVSVREIKTGIHSSLDEKEYKKILKKAGLDSFFA